MSFEAILPIDTDNYIIRTEIRIVTTITRTTTTTYYTYIERDIY